MAVRPGGARSSAPATPGPTAIAPIRSFIAILLPNALRGALNDQVEKLRSGAAGVAWVAPDNLHLTLKFLGGVEPDRLERVVTALATAAAGAAPFDLAVRGLGAFPSLTRPRVIWAGVIHGGAELAALAGEIETRLAPIGFAREERPFSAHVTLGRVREPRRDPALATALGAAATREYGRVRVDSVALMRSDLSPRGTRYSVLGSWTLGG